MDRPAVTASHGTIAPPPARPGPGPAHPQRAGIPAGHAAAGAPDRLQEPRPASARGSLRPTTAGPLAGSGGLSRDDLRRDGQLPWHESNTRDIVGDGPLPSAGSDRDGP